MGVPGSASTTRLSVSLRLLELLKPRTADRHGEDEDEDEFVSYYEELVHLLRWLKIDRFDRRAANRGLAKVAGERVV